MILQFSMFMWVLAVSVPLYWAISARHLNARLLLLSCTSAVVLVFVSPLILLSVMLSAIFVAVFAILSARSLVSKIWLRRASWFVFLPILTSSVVSPSKVANLVMGPGASNITTMTGLVFLGISYTTIRAFIMIRENLDQTAHLPAPTPIQAFTAFLFFGSFSAGPICGVAPYRKPAAALSSQAAVIAMSRIGWGVALFLVIKPILHQFDLTALAPEGSRTLAWLSVYHGFLVLYLDFTGYSEIAIGTALLYGIKLPENFNWPLRSTSIQEFWQRWHMSFGAFIGTYLFRPFVRKIGKPTWAIFLAFTAVGLWHTISVPYFLWGVGHGVALALNMVIRKKVPFWRLGPSSLRVVHLLGWAVTMSYVSLLSSFAGQPDFQSAIGLLAKLF